MNVNQATIVGRMVRDPELKALPSGAMMATFSVATSYTYLKDGQKEETTEYHNAVAFGKKAEMCGIYLKKGQLVSIMGRIQTRSWEKDGAKHYRTEILVDSVQFGPKAAEGDTKVVKEDLPTYPDDEIRPEDIPF